MYMCTCHLLTAFLFVWDFWNQLPTSTKRGKNSTVYYSNIFKHSVLIWQKSVDTYVLITSLLLFFSSAYNYFRSVYCAHIAMIFYPSRFESFPIPSLFTSSSLRAARNKRGGVSWGSLFFRLYLEWRKLNIDAVLWYDICMWCFAVCNFI